MFSYLSPEQRVRQNHPLRAVRAMADLALSNMLSVRAADAAIMAGPVGTTPPMLDGG
jgi:hypothetical protein